MDEQEAWVLMYCEELLGVFDSEQRALDAYEEYSDEYGREPIKVILNEVRPEWKKANA